VTANSSAFVRVSYSNLSAKQQEIYNFQKVAAVLADYGFNCIKLADDWLGADFLAFHTDAAITLRVQLKGRVTIDKKYTGKGLHIAFPIDGGWCVVEHDILVTLAGDFTAWLGSESWTIAGSYSSANPSKRMIEQLRAFILR
jgi:hypothetical protein